MTEFLDLRGVPCPMNAARAILAIEMSSAEEMVIWLDDGEPVINVKESLVDDGLTVLGESQEADTTWKLTVRVAKD